MYFIGTASWSLPRDSAGQFPDEGTHLQRYSKILNCTEINSSFHRAHSFSTYRRWAESTPANFKFSVKLPRAITHDALLRRTRLLLEQFLGEVRGLGKKLGPLLVQLAPSMEFDARVATRFFKLLRDLHKGAVVCEPRHRSWFEPRANMMLAKYGVSRVAADPAINQTGSSPGGAITSLRYYRVHGSPRRYWSKYDDDRVRAWASEVRDVDSKVVVWFIFDNTAAGHATTNALQLREFLAPKSS